MSGRVGAICGGSYWLDFLARAVLSIAVIGVFFGGLVGEGLADPINATRVLTGKAWSIQKTGGGWLVVYSSPDYSVDTNYASFSKSLPFPCESPWLAFDADQTGHAECENSPKRPTFRWSAAENRHQRTIVVVVPDRGTGPIELYFGFKEPRVRLVQPTSEFGDDPEATLLEWRPSPPWEASNE